MKKFTKEKVTINPVAPDEIPLTSEAIELKLAESGIDTEKKEKRGRPAGSSNTKKKDDHEVPESIKIMFRPLIIGIHNSLCMLAKVSKLTTEQESMVIESYSMMIYKRLPQIMENYGDIFAAVGATAFIVFEKYNEKTSPKETEVKNGTE